MDSMIARNHLACLGNDFLIKRTYLSQIDANSKVERISYAFLKDEDKKAVFTRTHVVEKIFAIYIALLIEAMIDMLLLAYEQKAALS